MCLGTKERSKRVRQALTKLPVYFSSVCFETDSSHVVHRLAQAYSVSQVVQVCNLPVSAFQVAGIAGLPPCQSGGRPSVSSCTTKLEFILCSLDVPGRFPCALGGPLEFFPQPHQPDDTRRGGFSHYKASISQRRDGQIKCLLIGHLIDSYSVCLLKE